MNYFKKTILPILLTGVWINLSETLRWEFLVKSYWVEHYQAMNLIFPTEMINNMTWMIWGFLVGFIIFIFSKKFNLLQTALLSWLVAFAMLWIVLWNINMLPGGILWIVVPMSFIETCIGAYICKKILSV